MKNLKLSILLSLVFVQACSSSSSHEEQAPIPLPTKAVDNLPTEVGNGINFQQWIYSNDRLGFRIKNEGVWKLLRTELKDGKTIISIQSLKDGESSEIQLRGNPAKNAHSVIASLQSQAKELLNPISLPHFVGYYLNKDQNRALLATNEIILEISAPSKSILHTIVASFLTFHPECSRFEKGFWFTFQKKDSNGQIDLLKLTIEDIDLSKNQLLVRRNSDLPLATISCRNAQEEILSGLARSDYRRRQDSIHFNQTEVTPLGILKTIQIEEYIQPRSATIDLNLKLVTSYSDDIPGFSIAAQRFFNGNQLIVEWSLQSYGREEKAPNEPTLRARFMSETDQIILDRFKTRSTDEQLGMANIFLSQSKPQLAEELYDSILENSHSREVLNIRQASQAAFGRAYTRLLLLFDRAEYQDLLTRMGFDRYSFAYQYFGKDGLLSYVSKNRDHKNNQGYGQTVMNLGPFPVSTERPSEILTRSLLTMSDYVSILPSFITHLEEIRSDFERAALNSNLSFDIPGSLFHLKQNRKVFQLETLGIIGLLELTISASHYVLAYEPIRFPLRYWFGLGAENSEERKTDDFKKQSFLFADEFNRSFLKLKSKDAMALSKSHFERSLLKLIEFSVHAQDLEIMSMINRKPNTVTAFSILQSHLEDALNSLRTGEVPLRSHFRSARINLKAFFDNPFDSRSSYRSVLAYVDPKTEEVRFKIDREIFYDWAKSLTPTRELFQRKTPPIAMDSDSNPSEVAYFFPNIDRGDFSVEMMEYLSILGMFERIEN